MNGPNSGHRPGGEPLRILLVSPAIAPPIGGIARLAEDIRASVSRHAHVTTCGISERPRRGPEWRIVELKGRSRRARTAAALTFARLITTEALSRRHDLIHAETWKSAVPLAFIPRRLRCPYVVHCLGAELQRGGLLTRAMRRMVLRRAAALVAISRYTKELASRICDAEVHLVTPGIETVHTPEPDRHADRGFLRILSVGELVPPKGHVELIQAVSDARQNGADYRLAIVGHGPERPSIDRCIRSLAAESWCEVLSGIDDEELWRMYQRSDLFALLTRDYGDEFEGFGIVFIEAASYGLPIVAGASGGAREAVAEGSNAIIVRTRSEAADALVRLWRHPEERARMSEEGLRHARRFLLADRAVQLLDIYRRALHLDGLPRSARSKESDRPRVT